MYSYTSMICWTYSVPWYYHGIMSHSILDVDPDIIGIFCTFEYYGILGNTTDYHIKTMVHGTFFAAKDVPLVKLKYNQIYCFFSCCLSWYSHCSLKNTMVLLVHFQLLNMKDLFHQT